MNEYKDERDILEKDIKALEGKSATYSGVRFVMFLAALAGLIIGIYDNRVTVLILGIMAAVAFVAMVFIHGKLSEELEYKKAKSEVLRRYIERFGDGWKKFEDNGAQYLGDDDLDDIDDDGDSPDNDVDLGGDDDLGVAGAPSEDDDDN